MEIFQCILWGSLTYYLGTLLIFILGNRRKIDQTLSNETPIVSVIVAVRNGELSLPNLLNDLSSQDYKGEIEFIIVNDESEDKSEDIILNYCEHDPRFRLVLSENGHQSLRLKKRALDAGITSSSGEILLFTDVDCRMSSGWVSSMISYFTQNIDYVIGNVSTDHYNTIVTVFQQIDLHMLLTASRGMTNLGYPWASIGQNQAYRKAVFEKTGGFSPISGCLQGDDSLFLQVARKKAGISAAFGGEPDSLVKGRTETTWKGLLLQRLRWAGDANIMWKFNPVFFLTICTTFLTNFLLLIIFIIYLGDLKTFAGTLSLVIIIKFAFEYSLFRYSLLSKQHSIVRFIQWFFIQIPYVSLMGGASFFSHRLFWHGRKK